MEERKILKFMKIDGIIGAIGFLIFYIRPILFGLISDGLFQKVFAICSNIVIAVFLIVFIIQIRKHRNHLSDEREFETLGYAAVKTINIMVFGLIIMGLVLSIILKCAKIYVPSSEISSFFEAIFFAIISIFSFSYLYYTENPKDLEGEE